MLFGGGWTWVVMNSYLKLIEQIVEHLGPGILVKFIVLTLLGSRVCVFAYE